MEDSLGMLADARPHAAPTAGAAAFTAATWYLLGRHVRAMLRQPIWIAVMLVQPAVWLLLFGQLFQRVVEIPGFGANSYIQFLAPGIVVMMALFSAAWSGMGIIEDIDRGVLPRLLATPISRAAIIAARVLYSALGVIVQSVIIIAGSYLLGARIENGIAGALALVAAAALLAAAFSGLSNGVALLTRKDETLIAVVNFISLPLNFLSSVLMAPQLMPPWMQAAAAVNPVNWAAIAARAAADPSADWTLVLTHLALLAALAVLALTFATWAFRAYQRAL
jgi:ABC-2 type transport system permease protein